MINGLKKVFIFVLCLAPFGILLWRAIDGDLGPNPQEALNRELGQWTLRFLLVALAVTPIRLVSKWNGLQRFRRMLGLYAAFYATMHLTSYTVLDQQFNWLVIFEDIIKRPFITFGMIAFLLMLPLALTSTKGWIKRIGGRNWQRLHRLVYISGIGGCLHFLLMVKGRQEEPAIYAGILFVLLGTRLFFALKKRLGKRK